MDNEHSDPQDPKQNSSTSTPTLLRIHEHLTTKQRLSERYQAIRQTSIDLCKPLEIEDYVVQPVSEVSPPKWHLGHTTWFFEELILVKHKPDYQRFNEHFPRLFNSYYKSAGEHWVQAERGQLSRPTVAQIMDYRRHVDDAIKEMLSADTQEEAFTNTLIIGLHHEQQHQELLLMDIKRILSFNPDHPSYLDYQLANAPEPDLSWKQFDAGVYQIGHDERELNNDTVVYDSFYYDNEAPRHKRYLENFSVRASLVSNGEFLAFIDDGGYHQPKLWLSAGWDWVTQEQIKAPLYWRKVEDQWFEYTLYGLKPLDLNAPVCHVSLYEAAAFALWSGHRLPTEAEYEIYETSLTPSPSGDLPPLHPDNANHPSDQTWCWTNSQYLAYPEYKAFDDELFEYNSKFMCNQFVLRGGCVFTPPGHYRPSYRNFYQPQQRWMMSGIRLAKGD